DEATPASALSRLTPAVRRLLAERGLDPSTIRGSGEGGRITVDDVLAQRHSQVAPAREDPAPASPRAGVAPVSSAEPAQHQIASHSVPHSAVRRRIADHMVQSLLHTAPHVTTVFEADMSAVMAHRTQQRADFEHRGAPLTYTAYFLAAAVAAIRAVPEANS